MMPETLPQTLPDNLLPYDGALYDLGLLTHPKYSIEACYEQLLELPWQADKVTLFGKTHITKRRVVWMGNDGICYRYSGHTRHSIPWHPLVYDIKRQIEAKLHALGMLETAGDYFNACLLNDYPTGNEGMGYHADNEAALGDTPLIATWSLGATRKIAFKHQRTRCRIELVLPSGALNLMAGATQAHWKHTIPKTKKADTGRISLTFRRILF